MEMDEIKANIVEMNGNKMHETDQLVIMVDTQRALIRILQKEIRELKAKNKWKNILME